MPFAMDTMEVELPLLIYGNQLLSNVQSPLINDITSCRTFYQKHFGMDLTL